MEYTVDDLVDGLSYSHLLRMQFDLNHGALHLKKLVDARIRMLEAANRKVCAACGNDIDSENASAYTVVFGPSDFRKKATCCGMDCFEEFIVKLKQYEGIKTTLAKQDVIATNIGTK